MLAHLSAPTLGPITSREMSCRTYVADDNPILGPWSGNPYSAPPFERITCQHVLPALKRCIVDATAAIEEICGLQADPTFANTVIPYESDDIFKTFRKVESLFEYLVGTSAAFQSVKKEGVSLLRDYHMDVCQIKLLGRLSKVPTQHLAAEDARLILILIQRIVTKGAIQKDDGAAQNETKAALATELAALSNAYKQEQAMVVPTELLLSDPLSASDAQLLSKYAQPQKESDASLPSVHCFSIPYSPDVFQELLAKCSVRSVRELIWTNSRNIGKPANYTTARNILIIRSQMSSIMGFENHAQYTMRNSMVNDPEKVIEMYKTLLEPSKRAFQKELRQLLELSRCDGISDPADFRHWDYKFYTNRMHTLGESHVSSEQFPMLKLSEVMNGLCWLVQELYSVTMSPAQDAPMLHDGVLAYSLKRSSEAPIGLLYVDVWARDGKPIGKRWAHQIFGCLPVVSLNCDFKRLFPDPEGLNFDQVKSGLLHEFGHCLHCLLSDVKYASMSGMTTPDDHVELPSGLHEQFMSDPRFLSQITTATLPAGICSTIIANVSKSIGYRLLRSLSSSILDLRLNMLPLDVLETLDVEQFEKDLYTELGIPPQVPYLYESSAFDHSFRYDYRYYM